MFTFNSSMDPLSPQYDPYYSSPSNKTSVPIAAIIAVGFFATSLVITIYYLLVVKFWLNNQQRQPDNNYTPPIFFSYETEGPGVVSSVIKSIPIVTFRKGEDKGKAKNLSFHECAVCLADFQDKESIKVLPGCSHAFHIDCIDTWLQFNINCPMCRSVVSSSSLAQKLDDHIGGLPEMETRGGETHEGNMAAHRDENGVRRSFSMDWFRERRIKRGEASTSSTSAAVNGAESGRFMRLVHSFRLGRSSRNAVLPVEIMEP